jgi:hypothetical protein
MNKNYTDSEDVFIVTLRNFCKDTRQVAEKFCIN